MTTNHTNITSTSRSYNYGCLDCENTCKALFYSSCLCTAAAIYATANQYPNKPLSLETFAKNPIRTWQENPKVTAIGIGLLMSVEPICFLTNQVIRPIVKTVFWDYLQMTTGFALGCLSATAAYKLSKPISNS
jgi:hypothetical protein